MLFSKQKSKYQYRDDLVGRASTSGKISGITSGGRVFRRVAAKSALPWQDLGSGHNRDCADMIIMVVIMVMVIVMVILMVMAIIIIACFAR